METQLAEAQKALARNEAERELLAYELQVIYGSNAWRTAVLLRRVARIILRPQLAASALVTRSRGRAAAAMLRISGRSRDRAARLKRAWTSTRNVVGRQLLWCLARLAGSWRLGWSSPRTMWGVTPILTLPLLAKCDRLLGLRSESLVFTAYHTTNSF